MPQLPGPAWGSSIRMLQLTCLSTTLPINNLLEVHNSLGTSKGTGTREGLVTCYSTAYTSQTCDQQRCTISEMAADWHEPMVPQRICGHPLTALMDNWTHGAASRHTITPISHTRSSPRSLQ